MEILTASFLGPEFLLETRAQSQTEPKQETPDFRSRVSCGPAGQAEPDEEPGIKESPIKTLKTSKSV